MPAKVDNFIRHPRLSFLVVSMISGFLSMMWWRGQVQGDDWASLWIAGMLYGDGEIGHLYDYDPVDFSAIAGEHWFNAAQEVSSPYPHPYVHIPWVSVATNFMQHFMTYSNSLSLLAFLSGFSATVIIVSMYRMWSDGKYPNLLTTSLGSVLIQLFFPFQISVWFGQTTPMIIAGVLFSLAFAYKHPYLAGIVLGIVASIKITPVLLIAFLFLSKKYKAAIVSSVTLVILTVLSILLTSWGAFLTWIAVLRRTSKLTLVSRVNESIPSLFHKEDALNNVPVLVIEQSPVICTVLLGIAVVIGLGIWFLDFDKRYPWVATWLLASIMIFSPIVWTHYYIINIVLLIGIYYTYRLLAYPAACMIALFGYNVKTFDPLEPTMPFVNLYIGIGLVVFYIVALMVRAWINHTSLESRHSVTNTGTFPAAQLLARGM